MGIDLRPAAEILLKCKSMLLIKHFKLLDNNNAITVITSNFISCSLHALLWVFILTHFSVQYEGHVI